MAERFYYLSLASMPSHYYKILIPSLLLIAVAGLAVAIGYRDMQARSTISPVTANSFLAIGSSSQAATSAPISPQPVAQTVSSSVVSTSPSRTAPVSAPSSSATVIVGDTQYRVAIAGGETLEDALTGLATQGSFTFTQKNYLGLGEFVDSINGKKSGGGYYWFLYVNGKISNTGVSTTHLSQSDVVEWRYDRSY
ncbi:DUF4430 domain-containing protein [Patescibacteria group bacterium]|nr:DUF4430 domain-containing protein [Patescibacteria group bacterium]